VAWLVRLTRTAGAWAGRRWARRGCPAGGRAAGWRAAGGRLAGGRAAGGRWAARAGFHDRGQFAVLCAQNCPRSWFRPRGARGEAPGRCGRWC